MYVVEHTTWNKQVARGAHNLPDQISEIANWAEKYTANEKKNIEM